VSVRLVALHGFLGHAADWDHLADEVPDAQVHALDLWKALDVAGVHDWASATAAVDRVLADRCGLGPSLGAEAGVAEAAGPAVFVVAYSFGARLALGSRLLSSAESPVRGCCFVSCNPGLPDGDGAGRAARRESDAAWARRIREDPEDALWREWDSQPVFAGSTAPAGRRQLPATRDVLVRALTSCSLAGQPDLRPRLRAWPTPVLWVTGARDSKFVAMARELASAGVPGEFVTCDGAGHRVPWDDPAAFAAALGAWIARHQA
jgi:2-succinyl-6-hydroxy-2,4-cyclohexadiene-1-carboxylate synthase